MSWTAEGELVVEGAVLHWYRTGTGPSVVLAHGVSDNGNCWEVLAGTLADAFEVVAYDARFHGLSTGDERERFAGADLLGLIEGLGLDRPAGVGHSMGAITIAGAAARRPDALRAVVLEDPPWHDNEARRQDLASALPEGLRHLVDGTYEEILARGRAWNAGWDEADLVSWAQAKTQFRLDDWLRSGGLAERDWRSDVKAIRRPALLVCGEPSRFAIVTPAVAREAAALGRDLRVVTLPAGHSIRREAPVTYLSAVRRFLLDTAVGSPQGRVGQA